MTETSKRFRFATERLEKQIKDLPKGSTFSTKIYENPDLYIEDLRAMLTELSRTQELLDEAAEALYLVSYCMRTDRCITCNKVAVAALEKIKARGA